MQKLQTRSSFCSDVAGGGQRDCSYLFPKHRSLAHHPRPDRLRHLHLRRLSIAWAVVEHLHRDPTRGPRTLFVTHYQELTQLDKHLPRLRNCSVAVKEWNDEIVFVRRVIPGAADRSYGIQVARLAGLPLSVIDRAKTILAKLESDDTSISLPAPQAKPKKKITVAPADDSQLNLL